MPSVADNSPEFNPQSDWPSRSRQEIRRGWANCYPVRKAQRKQLPVYAGVTVSAPNHIQHGQVFTTQHGQYFSPGTE